LRIGAADKASGESTTDEGAVHMAEITQRETAQIDQSNESGRVPVVFIHGLWLLPSSWDRWAEVFNDAGFAPLTPSWPDDPATVEQARANPEVFANKTVGQVADHVADVIAKLKRKPAVVGHSFGGLFAQISPGAVCPPSRSRLIPHPSVACSHCRSPR
jgi:non-heme chloroperoxidase